MVQPRKRLLIDEHAGPVRVAHVQVAVRIEVVAARSIGNEVSQNELR